MQKKATANQKKQGISFEESKSVFYDDGYSGEEHRFLMLDLVVNPECSWFVIVSANQAIRLSRKSTKSECSHYKGNAQ